jgi:hypothetical protein
MSRPKLLNSRLLSRYFGRSAKVERIVVSSLDDPKRCGQMRVQQAERMRRIGRAHTRSRRRRDTSGVDRGVPALALLGWNIGCNVRIDTRWGHLRRPLGRKGGEVFGWRSSESVRFLRVFCLADEVASMTPRDTQQTSSVAMLVPA